MGLPHPARPRWAWAATRALQRVSPTSAFTHPAQSAMAMAKLPSWSQQRIIRVETLPLPFDGFQCFQCFCLHSEVSLEIHMGRVDTFMAEP